MTVNFFKPVSYKLAERSFCIPAPLVTYGVFLAEAFIQKVFTPSYPSEVKDIGLTLEAIVSLVFVGHVEYILLKALYKVRHTYKGAHPWHFLLLSSYWSLVSCGLDFLYLLQPSINSWFGWVLVAYFIYGIYITIGVHRNHPIPNCLNKRQNLGRDSGFPPYLSS